MLVKLQDQVHKVSGHAWYVIMNMEHMKILPLQGMDIHLSKLELISPKDDLHHILTFNWHWYSSFWEDGDLKSLERWQTLLIWKSFLSFRLRWAKMGSQKVSYIEYTLICKYRQIHVRRVEYAVTRLCLLNKPEALIHQYQTSWSVVSLSSWSTRSNCNIYLHTH